MTSRILLGAFLAACLYSVAVTHVNDWGDRRGDSAPAVVLLIAFLASAVIDAVDRADGRLREKLSDAITRLESAAADQAAEALLYKARIEGLERKLEEPVNGLTEQVRSLRNRMGINGK